jgi:solute carrier family 25 (mitochondrial phosphate transporter), member 23/24/25/41
MAFLTARPHSQASFSEFRDFFLLLPRKISPEEIYRYYQVAKYLGDDGRGAARVTMEGDVSLSAEDKPPVPLSSRPVNVDQTHRQQPAHHSGEEEDELDPEEHDHATIGNHAALKFLLAGGIAGAVSRSCTAPFDRLKIFLITRPQDLGITSSSSSIGGVKAIGNAITRIYTEGGLLAFWTGNGLSVAKIFPESAIKFFSYEYSKRTFARYWDQVDDPRDISGVSRFLSGGIGGITSQLSIYPLETLKTQMMSSSGKQKRTLMQAAQHLWTLGGLRAYYRGLVVSTTALSTFALLCKNF